MKKYLLFIFIILSVSINSFAQDFSGIKICINPGHGGFDSNDRFIAATGFWESAGNLVKGLYLRDILEGMNADIVMTRTTNTSADDLPLSQIVAIANSNNVDYFQSIHSNAFNAQSNYTLILFQGFDNNPTYDSAKVMGNLLADEIQKAHRTTAKHNRGDFDFYGTGEPYLGVFKNLNMPGTLSEGSFHDYVPESWRLRNDAYCKHEAWAITRGFIDYFHRTKPSYGEIAGIVRDPSKGVPYYAIPATNDIKKPLNNITVTLQPNNIIFNGDNFNNGFFMFDSLAPGNYKVIYEAEGFFKDSTDITVIADASVFADKYLTFDTTIAPVILSHYPLDQPDSVKTVEPIEISFSRPMNKEATQNAFSINPIAEGTFTWEENDQKIIFTPDQPLIPSTFYTVNLSAEAKSIWNVPIDSSFSFNFNTKSRFKLTIEETYPLSNQTDISTTVQIRLIFDAPVFQSSLANRINLYNSNNIRLSVKNVKVFSENGKGYIYFEPKDELGKDSIYKLLLSEGIIDLEGYPLPETLEIFFTTTSMPAYTSIMLNGFESLEGWSSDIEGSNVTADFNITISRKISGNSSGKLDYIFNSSSEGSIQLSNSTILSTQGTAEFGTWIFGDYSYNILEYTIANDSLQSTAVFVDTISWTGWKLKKIPVSVSANVSETVYYSLIIKKAEAGALEGSLYFDEVQFISTTVGIDHEVNLAEDYHLYQNYPNPFNPETLIKFNIPERNFITLKVYDVLGNEVATLINEERNSGLYSVSFSSSMNGISLSSGVYFYTITAGKYMAAKKFILLK